jgi:hypothetical protein
VLGAISFTCCGRCHLQVTGMDIKPDEGILRIEDHGKLSWDGKRDLWQGYREEEFDRVVARYVESPVLSTLAHDPDWRCVR